MKLRIVCVSVVWGLAIFCFCYPQVEASEGAGVTSGITLIQPVSARSAGRGEIGAANDGDIGLIQYNPAGLAFADQTQVGTMYQRGFDDDTLAYCAVGTPIGWGSVAGSVMYFGTGKIDMYDLNGNRIRKTGQQDIVVSMGTGMRLFDDRAGLGIMLKGISSEIFGETATAFAVDTGFMVRNLIGSLDWGVSVLNLGTQLKYLETKEDLPAQVRTGVAYRMALFQHEFIPYLEIPYLVHEQETLGLFGVEYVINRLIALRAGYKRNFDDASRDDERDISLGIGFIWHQVSLDYAIGITDDLSNPHFVSLNAKF
ncbi:MAG: PorV/PorQ family protein [Elusimicrobia bacterium]|nr:PorV/PorQ family protein [Elusimicrobiota bacterium]MBD3412605.1 PorV/PorQ family protein [Elusimicrobiota bacterium]